MMATPDVVISPARELEDVTTDEVACCILVSVLKKAAVPLGVFVKQALISRYGEDRWMGIAKQSFSKKMQEYFTRDGQLTDIYLIFEVLMAQLDQVFIRQAVDIDGVKSHAVLLSSVAREIQGVCQTRTWLFHSFEVSAREVHGCLLKFSRLWRRFFSRHACAGSFLQEVIESSLLVSLSRKKKW